MPAQVCVEGVIHGRNITLAGYVTASDDLPGKVQPRGRPLTIVAEMLALHIADRHRTDRCVSDLVDGRGRRVPGGGQSPGSVSIHRVKPTVIFPMRKSRPPRFERLWPGHVGGDTKITLPTITVVST